MQSCRILRLPEVLQKVGLSRSSIYRMINNEEFPAPLRISPNAIGWFESDVNEWINSRFKTQ